MYAGMQMGQFNRTVVGRQGDAMIEAQRAVLRDQVLKAWSEERKEVIRKYQRSVGGVQRFADSVNEYIMEKGPLTVDQMKKIEGEFYDRAATANDLMQGLVEDQRQKLIKAGVTTSTGFVFYDLRGPSYMVFPVNTPIINSMPRLGAVNAGVGTAAHWKYSSIGPSAGTSSNNYAGAAEGKRVGTSFPNEIDAVATYACLGSERAVSFEADFASEGFTPLTADEHQRGLMQLKLQEEGTVIGGNAGTASGLNGFVLGTANTPSGSLAASIPAGAPSDGSTAGWTNTTKVAAYVIELTLLGFPTNAQYGYQAAPTVGATGLVPTYTRPNADGTTDPINGGMGAVSAPSSVQTAITSTPYTKFSVVPKKGAIAWAWYIDDQDAVTPSKTNALLAAITDVPYCYFGANSTDTLLSGNQNANATGLNADHSYNTLDFSGIMAWTVNNGTWTNMSDISKIDPSTGSTFNGLLQPTEVGSTKVPGVLQLDYDLEQQWNGFQTVGDVIYCSADTKLYISRAIALAGNAAYRFNVDRDQQGNILGGFVVSGYKSVFSMKATGSEEIPLMIHPMMPLGSYMINKITNPYPWSRIPAARAILTQRDYYGIEWPLVTRTRTWGTYVNETYADYLPGLEVFRTGIQGVSST